MLALMFMPVRKSHEDCFLVLSVNTLMSSLPGHRLRILSATNSQSQTQVDQRVTSLDFTDSFSTLL